MTKKPPQRRQEFGFIALVPTMDKDESGKAVVVREIHYNRRLYRHLGEAKRYLEEAIANPRYLKAAAAGGEVVKMDTSILEPAEMTAEEERQFSENMLLYWGDRYKAAEARAAAGELVPPKQKRQRRKKTKPAPPTNPQLSKLAKQALTIGAAAAIGQMVGNLLAPKKQDGQSPPPLVPLVPPLYCGQISPTHNLNVACQLAPGHGGPHRFGHITW